MTLSTWQLVVVGVLIAAWVIVLGGPAVVDAYRWFTGRSRRRHARQHNPTRSTRRLRSGPQDAGNPVGVDIDGHGVSTGDQGRYRPAWAGGRAGDTLDPAGHGPGWTERLHTWWRERPRPLAAWRTQDVVQRRVQLMLGLSVATFSSMFLAIALRGVFVRLFLLMLGVMAISLVAAAYIGAVELRHHRAQTAAGRADEHRSGRIIDATPSSGPVRRGDGLGPMTMADEGFRQADDNEPGLIFEPLNLDEIVSELGRDRLGVSWGEEIRVTDSGFEVPIDPELARELGIEETVDQIREGAGTVAQPPDSDESPSNDAEGERTEQPGRHDATFTAAPEAGARQASARARSKKKRQARPIYIESTLDDDENQWKAASDQ